MPISTQCPHCQKSYKLKDALAGRKVTCANPNCRQVFMARPKEESSAAIPFDAETMAMEALAEEIDTGPAVAEKQIPMSCGVCDFQWTEAWSKQGKNTLCPDCRTRQRVPMQKESKPADWRDPNARGPSMARQEKLEGVVASTTTQTVFGDTLKRTGVIREELEPRPRWHYVAMVLLPLALVGTIVFGVLAYMNSVQQNQLAGQMDEAVTLIDADGTATYPEVQVPLFKARIYMAAGEFEARKATSEDELNVALEHFSQAQRLLSSAPRSPGRDMLIGELALAMFSLTGTEAQVDEGSRIPWRPSRTGRARMSGKSYSLQQELDRVLALVADPGKAMPIVSRLDLVRRLTRKLVEAGQGDLADTMVARAFQGDESLNNATAWVLAERLHAGDAMDAVRPSVERLAASLGTTRDPVLFALAQSVQPPLDKVEGPAPPSGNGAIDSATRDAYTVIYLLAKDSAKALEVAQRPGSIDDRLESLALVAEWSADPAPPLPIAQEMAAKAPKSVSVPDFPLVRLSRQAGRSGNTELVSSLAGSIESPGFKAWAWAASAGARTGNEVLPLDVAPVPDDPKGYQVGHASARLSLARHNARVGGPATDYSDWNEFRPFGLAGEALGLQDRERE